MTPDADRMARLIDVAWRLGLERLPQWLRENGEAGGLELRLLTMRCLPAPGAEVPTSSSPDPKALSMDAAGKMLGVSGRTIQRLIKRGELQAIRVCGSPRVPVTELDAYIDRRLGAA